MIGLLLCAGLVALLLPAVSSARTAAQKMTSANNLKEIGLALHSYHDQHGHFPAPAIVDEDGQSLLSWRVALLPSLGRQELYDRFDLTEPWNGPTNQPLLAEMPRVFNNPAAELSEGETVYLAIHASEAVFTDEQPTRFADIQDGTSNTAVVIEAGSAVPWSAPQDISLDQAVTEMTSGEPRTVLLADGSVHTVTEDVDPERARAIFTRSGGERGGFSARREE